jgi:hypothetical protein
MLMDFILSSTEIKLQYEDKTNLDSINVTLAASVRSQTKQLVQDRRMLLQGLW